MKKGIITTIVLLAAAAVYYYAALPALNIHSAGVWYFLLALVALAAVFYALRKRLSPGKSGIRKE